MRDEALRTRMGRAGAERVRQRVNYRTMAAGMESVYYEAIAAVGEERRTRRIRHWPRSLPLFTPSEEVTIQGHWIARTATNGQTYKLGKPGAIISFQASPGTWLQITALRHDWSGILEVRGGGDWVRHLDLYQPHAQFDYQCHIDVPVNGTDESVTVTFRVLPERNPASFACEVWLKQIAVSSAEAIA